MLIDDDPVIRAILGAALGRAGYAVSTAADADEALAVVRESQPTVILVDRLLPGRDGIDLCREIRAEPGLAERALVLLLTADADRVDPASATAAGIDAVLSKSLAPAALTARIEQLLGERAQT